MKKQLFLFILMAGIMSSFSIAAGSFSAGTNLTKLLNKKGEKLQAFATLLVFLAQDAQITQQAAHDVFAMGLNAPVIPVLKTTLAKIHGSLYNDAVAELDMS